MCHHDTQRHRQGDTGPVNDLDLEVLHTLSHMRQEGINPTRREVAKCLGLLSTHMVTIRLRRLRRHRLIAFEPRRLIMVFTTVSRNGDTYAKVWVSLNQCEV